MLEFTRSTGRLDDGVAFARALPLPLQAKEPAQYALAADAMRQPPPSAGGSVDQTHTGKTASVKQRPNWRFAMETIARQCWPTYVGSGHQGLLTTLWQQAAYARYAEEELGLSNATQMTPTQGQLAELKYPPPRNIGGIGVGV